MIKTCLRLVSLLRKTKPQVVQTWMYHANFFGGIVAKACGIKHIVWGIRCEGIELKTSTRWIKQGCSFLSFFIPNLILSNSKVAADAHIKTGYDPQKMRVVHNGFDTVYFSPQRPEVVTFDNQQLDPHSLLIGTLARFHPDKDYHNLIQTIDTVCEVHHNVIFVLCGPGCHKDNEALQAMLRPVTYQHRVILLNGVEDTCIYLNQLHVFVMASKTESFPNALAEAMLCGLPCIATDVGETKEIVGDSGVIIPPQNSEQLASACLTLLNKSEVARNRMGMSARQRIINRYSMARLASEMSHIYNRRENHK